MGHRVSSGRRHRSSPSGPDGCRIVRQGKLLPQAVEGVPAVAHSSQGGLLEVLPHPNFATNRLLYLTYSKPDAPSESRRAPRVIRGRFENDRLTGVEELFQAVSQGRGHFSGKLAFDKAGYLFVTLGDRQVPPEGNLEAHPAQDLVQSSRQSHSACTTTVACRPTIRSSTATARSLKSGATAIATCRAWRFTPKPATSGPTSTGHKAATSSIAFRRGLNYGWPVIGFGVNYTTGLAIHSGTHRKGMEQPMHIWVPSIGISGAMFYTGDKFPAVARQPLRRRHGGTATRATDAPRDSAS